MANPSVSHRGYVSPDPENEYGPDGEFTMEETKRRTRAGSMLFGLRPKSWCQACLLVDDANVSTGFREIGDPIWQPCEKHR